jgi:hypothetical protein
MRNRGSYRRFIDIQYSISQPGNDRQRPTGNCQSKRPATKSAALGQSTALPGHDAVYKLPLVTVAV